MIYVTRPYFPPLEEYVTYISQIWDNKQLTNAGPFATEFENLLSQHLAAKHCFFVANGTLAIQIAIKALDLKGDIITTPFSYVATTSSIVWENCNPVFVDIEPTTLTIDPQLIEAKITPNTTAILATHVFGNPCAIEAIADIAAKHNLKVIYDAAHGFGVKYKGTSLVNYGDISTLSFHATKILNTGEGGAIIAKDKDVAHKVSYMKNFGHNGPEEFYGCGINAKNSELHAALGLCNLRVVNNLIAARKIVCDLYDQYFINHPHISRPQLRENTEYNYSYYPIIFSSEDRLLEVVKHLNAQKIFPRRYFYPSLSTLNYVQKSSVPVCESITTRVLCLPLYHDLSLDDVEKIAKIVLEKCK
jgi:dTDP-4-amino-4,6-dideoxygalactose transaminase